MMALVLADHFLRHRGAVRVTRRMAKFRLTCPTTVVANSCRRCQLTCSATRADESIVHGPFDLRYVAKSGRRCLTSPCAALHHEEASGGMTDAPADDIQDASGYTLRYGKEKGQFRVFILAGSRNPASVSRRSTRAAKFCWLSVSPRSVPPITSFPSSNWTDLGSAPISTASSSRDWG